MEKLSPKIQSGAIFNLPNTLFLLYPVRIKNNGGTTIGCH